MFDESNQIMKERYDLVMERIGSIGSDQDVPAPFDDYFKKVSSFILMMEGIRKRLETEGGQERSLEEWQAENRRMYEDILPENYEESYANPAWAVRKLGKAYGRILCFLYGQIRGIIGYYFDGLEEAALIHLELFVEIYNRFEQPELPSPRDLTQAVYWFISDYTDVLVTERVRQGVDPARDKAVRVILDSDLEDLRYLYRYGEYVSEDEMRLAAYLNSLSQEKIDRMARTYAQGFKLSFVRTGRDLSKMMTVNIHFHLGFERVVRSAIGMFKEMGLRPVIYRYALSCVNRRGAHRSGYTGANPNPQYDYDHREDPALFLDRKFMDRRLGVLRKAYDTFQTLAGVHAGPAVIDTFGEKPFIPVNKEEALTLSEKQQQITVDMSREGSAIVNRYINPEERSFTIIAFPLPSIGERFEEIFDETMKVNTLDEDLYRKIQQALIDTLDRGRRVHVLGSGANRTDLTVALGPLSDPEKESNFENVLADMNIPVGEVFTSPRLEGTNGLLHVTGVYLEGLYYKDLSVTFRDGMIADYSCGNFESEQEGRDYIKANVLHHHKTLPMGEFAIGTNTTAYAMAQRFDIGALLPILIAEKTGPHFAVGDTCYSWSEDMKMYNPDGKECVARDNSISILRKEDTRKAYFGCHTDITIPYSELRLIEVIDDKGESVPIIRDGRFVLEGTQALNEALEGLD